MPECFKDDNASQWKSGKFDPRFLRNPWIDRHLNLHGWLRLWPLPLCKISQRYGYPILPHPKYAKMRTRDSASFLVLPSAYSQDPWTYFHNQYVKWRRFAQVCAFQGSRKQNFTFRPNFPTKCKFLDNFWRDKISGQKALAMGMHICKLPLIIIVAPWKLYRELGWRQGIQIWGHRRPPPLYSSRDPAKSWTENRLKGLNNGDARL